MGKYMLEFKGGIFRGLTGPALGSDRIKYHLREINMVMLLDNRLKRGKPKILRAVRDDFSHPVKHFEKLNQGISNGVCKRGRIQLA